jgi:DNA-binding response OmpR family regulator
VPASQNKASPPPRRILVIDDDEAVRTMLVRVLSDAGYVAVPAGSGTEAHRIFCRFDFDLGLLDLGMPNEDGWTTLRQLHAYDAEFPIFIITARPGQQAAAWTAGAAGCFEKPLDFEELLTAISRTLPAAGEQPASNEDSAAHAVAERIPERTPVGGKHDLS